MNKLNIQQTGGFPLTTNTLDFMQASMLLMQNFGEIAGNLTILSGCVVTGTQVSPGTVYINGEIMPFQGGTIGTNVVIQERKIQKQFEDGSAKPVEIHRWATFGNAIKSYPWADFTRITPIKVLQKALTPVGTIVMWNGQRDALPSGWVFCDGTNGTPDLRNKFILGSNGTNAGTTGGKDEITLQEVNMPPHNHTGSTNSAGGHIHSLRDGIGGSGTNSILGENGTSPNLAGSDRSKNWVTNAQLIGNAGAHSHTVNINSTGGLNGKAQPFDNRPAFYTLAFIMFKGE